MCGGFTCTKNALTALNILYTLVSFILIGVAAYSRAASFITSITIIGVIIACGVFLFLLSLLGLLGALRHHQVLLFFYMVILFLLFVIQFSIACACLAMTEQQQHELAQEGWKQASDELKTKTQEHFTCCGFDNRTLPSNDPLSHPPCTNIPECADSKEPTLKCPLCSVKLKNAINNALKICGGIGLFFSFTEFIGVWLTVRYRNQKDPRANPSAFL